MNRIPVQVRMSQVGVTRLDQIAEENQVTRTDVIRAAMKVALRDPEKIVAELDRVKELL